jgi:hypothetical protein
MKNIITLVLLTFTVSLFGQMKEYKKATNLYNDKKFSEANIILEKLINKEYGELEQEMTFYVLYMNAGCYYNLNDFKIANTKYEELIVFVKNSVNLFTTPSGKEETITSLVKFKEDFKSKIPKDENTSIQNNISSESNTITNSVSNEINTKTNSDNKTITLTVSGTGKTIEDAKLNALRSAIEQAFGAFISSKTEILNDNLVKDEIVSETNGNIEKYDIISQTEIPDKGWLITLNATVSIEKLTAFAESKGVIIEFKGGMFGLKIKLQKLNEKNELNACINILSVVHELFQNGYDFSIVNEDPKLFKDSKYSIKFKVNGKPNNNFHTALDYLKKSLSKLQMTENEILDYNNTNKEVFEFMGYKLRNKLSYKVLRNIYENLYFYTGNFNLIINNNKKISGPDLVNLNHEQRDSFSMSFEKPSFLLTARANFNENFGENHFEGLDGSEYYFDTNSYQFFYIWEQLFEISEIENINSISINSKGVNSRIKYGGFVIYENDKQIIIASPYSYDWDSTLSWKPVKTSEKIFEGKNNMLLFKDVENKNTIFDLIAKYNLMNNTDWHIPTSLELKLFVKEVYACKSPLNHLTYCSSTFSEPYFKTQPESFKFTVFKAPNSFTREKNYTDNLKFGIPFNSNNSNDILSDLFHEISLLDADRTWNGTIKIPLIKYINK